MISPMRGVTSRPEGVVISPMRGVRQTMVTRDYCSSGPPAAPGLLVNGSSRAANKLGNGSVLVSKHEGESRAVGPDRMPESGGSPGLTKYLEAGGPGLALSR